MARETSMKNNVGTSGHEASEGCPYRAALPAHPLIALAQTGGPVIFEPRMNMWLVTRYQDVVEALKDHQRFTLVGAIDSSMMLAPEVLELLKPALPLCRTSLLSIDPPDHTRLRALMNQAFTPRRVALMEPLVRQIVNRLVDQFIEEGQIDLVPRLAAQLPMHVISTMLGIPEADREQVKRWCFDWIKLISSPLPPEEQLACANSLLSHLAYMDRLIEQRRRVPQNDLISHMLNASLGDALSMSDQEITDTVNLLTLAGHETTAHMLGTCFYRLLSEPQRWQMVRDNPAAIEPIVEETLRLDSVSMGSLRITKEDVTLHGVTIPRGATVLLMSSMGNLDPTVFAEPDRFDPDRPHLSRHLAFGHGIHYCLGAPLGRLELRVAIEVLSQRLPSLRLVPGQNLSHLPSVLVRGLSQLWIAWDERPMARLVV